jgi:hypothetical protein
MNLGGYVYDQLGVAISGLTVELWAHDGVAATSSTTTSAAGYWQFTSVDATDTWKVKIINGTKVQWIHGGAEVQITGIQGVKKSIWALPAASFSGTLNYIDTLSYGLSGVYAGNTLNDALFTVPIPTDFVSLSKAVVVLLPKGTGNLYLSTSSSFAANGESRATHTDSVAAAAVAVVTNTMKEYDVSGALTGIAAGDYLGLAVLRDTTNVLDTCDAGLFIMGILIEYISAS